MTFNSWSLAVALASDIAVMMMSRSSENRFERNLGRVPTEFFGNCTPRSTLFPFSFMSRAWSKNRNYPKSTHRECARLRNLKSSQNSVAVRMFASCFLGIIYLQTIRWTVLWCTGVKFHLVLSSLRRAEEIERVTLEVYKFNILENPHNDSWQDVLRMY